MRFRDKVVLITGAASGIGLAIARRFASEGAIAVLADISLESLAVAELDVRAAGASDILTLVCDVSQEAQVKDSVGKTLEKFGRLDVVVNNAGLMLFKPIEEQTAEDWQRVLGVDLLGTFFFIKQAFLHMKPGGSIINIASIHAVETTPMVAAYAAAKAAVVSLTRSAAIEGKPKGIRVNAVLPGAIDTPMLWNNPNVKAGIERVDRADVGKPEDVAATVAFLASEDAAFVQGAAILVDGGRLNRL